MKYPVFLRVNGREHRAEVEARTLLSELLREGLGLTGTKVGCDGSACGACTVLLDGLPVRSCTMLAVQADGRDVLTVEGLAAVSSSRTADPSAGGDPLDAAFLRMGAAPCGFCSSGLLVAARDVLARGAERSPSRSDLACSLRGNACSCGGHDGILDAVEDAARRVAGRGEGS